MMAQQPFRPDIARVAEQVVVNLKTLETRIEALKYDLANLCTAVGHHEAARLAVTPVGQGYGTIGGLGQGLGTQGFGQFGQYGQGFGQGFGQGIGGYGTFGTVRPDVFGAGPGIGQGIQGVVPGMSPVMQGPYAQGGLGAPWNAWTNPWLQQQYR